MKIFRILAMLTISLLLFTGCDDDEITNYAFQEISAPTGVTAAFDVSQDDSGDVSITPSGEGAQVFKVYFGDGEDTPLDVAPGETVTYTYGEGEYLVRVVAVGATGLTSEFNQRLVISFKAPENLVVDVAQDGGDPSKVTISASADHATTFDVYFGDVDDEEPTQLMPDESIEHTYGTPGTYMIRVVAKGAGAATTETTVEVVIPDATDPLKLPVTFDDPLVGYNITPFGAEETAFEIIMNPELSGENSAESKVGAITKTGAAFEGVTFNLSEPVDLSGDNKKLSIKLYSEVAFPVLLKLETGVNGERSNEVLVDHGGTGWETLTFDFGTDAKTSYINNDDTGGAPIVPDGQYDAISLFLDFNGSADGVYYIDDLMQEAAAANCVAETDENIDPANGPINWTFKTNDEDHEFDAFGDIGSEIVPNPITDGINPSCYVQIVDKSPGCATWSGVGKPIATPIDFTTTDKKIFKLKVLAKTQTAQVTLRLEKEPHPDVDPAEDRVAEITQVGVWQELTFDFSDVDDKTFRSIIIYFERNAECDGDIYYFDDLIQTDGTGGGGSNGNTKTSFPVDFETAANGGAAANWSVFENVDNPGLEIITNPDMSGNTSATVAKFTARQGGKPWSGTITQLETPFTLDASNSTVKIMVWKSVISDVGIKFENASGGSTGEIKVANTKVNEWEELTFDFSGVIGNPENTGITGLVIFPDFQERTQENVAYFDNVTMGNGGGASSGAPAAAATAPALDASLVKSIFSDAYSDPAGVNYYPDWGQSTAFEMIDMGGDNFIKYSNANYQGIDFGEAIDATAYTTVHIDVWSGDYTSIPFFLISSSGERSVSLNVTPNQWNSIEIPLSEFTSQGLDISDVFQIKFDVQPDNGGTFYIDNLYFHN
ncbi:hypothetical protein [Christiangramia aquimixticola]|uniref:hypothetical protein n=1 Tax=Christiangramia aquimixticola TaxID=1697558 RepID=UPI003AA8F41C